MQNNSHLQQVVPVHQLHFCKKICMIVFKLVLYFPVREMLSRSLHQCDQIGGFLWKK